MAIFFQTTFDDVNFPTRRATGIHWDQTIDGISDFSVGQIGDGITGANNDVTANGAGDQILTAANNPAGGGGKGYRHWAGDGSNNGGGGINVNWTSVTEMWLRYYIRFQSGFTWSGSGNMKTVYRRFASQFYGGLHEGRFGFHVENDQINRNLDGIGNLHTSTTWDQWQGSPTGDGLFHCIEIHVKGNTGGAQNGTFECWLDGTLRGTWTDVRFDAANGFFDTIKFGENHSFIANGGVDNFVDFDDIVMSDSGYIGPLAPIGQPISSPIIARRNQKIWTYK